MHACAVHVPCMCHACTAGPAASLLTSAAQSRHAPHAAVCDGPLINALPSPPATACLLCPTPYNTPEPTHPSLTCCQQTGTPYTPFSHDRGSRDSSSPHLCQGIGHSSVISHHPLNQSTTSLHTAFSNTPPARQQPPTRSQISGHHSTTDIRAPQHHSAPPPQSHLTHRATFNQGAAAPTAHP
jgi:hypothetical protein